MNAPPSVSSVAAYAVTSAATAAPVSTAASSDTRIAGPTTPPNAAITAM